ncbi:hypothetical protein FHX74_000980 [Friedmanniella endophytica]|uniref:Uncharacterized protein n=1 Tax=Microlunatus kandeliicorticis TaxID=1759536 RepID=A0A7W3IQJ7_9ACTN|nr:DUF6886 family protein [Microlunatus kandeliicorticis]MBA8793375.1 hypothetical protein [Microlunatus kandeliicorticis]
MRPDPGTVLHFSEDPTIRTFAPHVARTAQVPDPWVWAVDGENVPSYWFPRQCPRAMAWVGPQTTAVDADRLLGPGARRVHVIEYGWLEAFRRVELWAYAFDAADFVPHGTPPSAMVADHRVTPLGPPRPVGDLVAAHADAGIQLRVVTELWSWWEAVIASSLRFSGIRLRNARPRVGPASVTGRPR